MISFKKLISDLPKNFQYFLKDFLLPLFCAYGIYFICAVITFKSTKSFIDAVIKQEFDAYDKGVRRARQFNFVLHIVKMIIYSCLIITGILWLFGWKKYFNLFWPIQPFFIIPLLLLEIGINYIIPSKPSAIIGSIIITMDYQGRKNVGKLIKTPQSILENFIIKLLKSDILGAFVSVFATSKMYWNTDFKKNINVWLIMSVIVILSHCFLIQYWKAGTVVKLLKNNISTEQQIYEWKANVITWIFIRAGLDPPEDSEMEVLINKFDLFSRNYYNQVNDEQDYSLNASLFEGILTEKEKKDLLYKLTQDNTKNPF